MLGLKLTFICEDGFGHTSLHFVMAYIKLFYSNCLQYDCQCLMQITHFLDMDKKLIVKHEELFCVIAECIKLPIEAIILSKTYNSEI